MLNTLPQRNFYESSDFMSIISLVGWVGFCFTVVGQLLMIAKKSVSFLIWNIPNTIQLILAVLRKNNPLTVIFSFYILINFVSFILWKYNWSFSFTAPCKPGQTLYCVDGSQYRCIGYSYLYDLEENGWKIVIQSCDRTYSPSS